MRKDPAHLSLLLLEGYARGCGVGELIQRGYGILNIAQQHIGHIARHTLTHHDTHNHHILDALGHRIGGHHPATLLQLVLQVEECPLGALGVPLA